MKNRLFLFLNLMETHLPFWPPGQFVDQVVPYFRESKEARTIMRTWNREAYRWAAPLAEPLGELEHHVLNDMYDAEVAYQDDYLGQLLDTIIREKGATKRYINHHCRRSRGWFGGSWLYGPCFCCL